MQKSKSSQKRWAPLPHGYSCNLSLVEFGYFQIYFGDFDSDLSLIILDHVIMR
jgi:hypothetical protein